MKLLPTPKQWLFEQMHREDAVGEVARQLRWIPPGTRVLRNHCTAAQWKIIGEEWEAVKRHPAPLREPNAFVARWVDECLTAVPQSLSGGWTSTSALMSSFARWSGSEGDVLTVLRTLKIKLPLVHPYKKGGTRGWLGVAVKHIATTREDAPLSAVPTHLTQENPIIARWLAGLSARSFYASRLPAKPTYADFLRWYEWQQYEDEPPSQAEVDEALSRK